MWASYRIINVVTTHEVLPNHAVSRVYGVGRVETLEKARAPELDLASAIRGECKKVFVLEYDHPRVWHVHVWTEQLGHFEAIQFRRGGKLVGRDLRVRAR